MHAQSVLARCADLSSPVGFSGKDALRAARLEWKDYEDCLVAICADKVKADYLITRDIKGFARSPVPVMRPEAWLPQCMVKHTAMVRFIAYNAPCRCVAKESSQNEQNRAFRNRIQKAQNHGRASTQSRKLPSPDARSGRHTMRSPTLQRCGHRAKRDNSLSVHELHPL